MKTFLLNLVILFTISVSAQRVSSDMIQALKNDDLKTFKTLVDVNRINECLQGGSSAYNLLALSIKANAEKCFDYLLKNKADVENTCESKTPLMYAVKYNRLDFAKKLIKNGANFKKENYKGRTAKDYAKKYKRTEMLNYLKSLE